MKTMIWRVLIVGLLLLVPSAIFAQEATEAPAQEVTLPRAYQLPGMTAENFEFQGWNNCGPATLTNGLDFFGYSTNQTRAANWLKPNGEDKNVSPWQMAEFVNTQVPELPVFAEVRAGGTQEQLKLLLANNFPVIIEAGYDPEPDRLGWMGHYLLVIGYDDSVGVFTTHDSYIGPSLNYTYDHIQEFWQHFNYTYIVLFTGDRRAELMELLGDDADPLINAYNALAIARAEATADQNDSFAWFNMGTNFVTIAQHLRDGGDEAAAMENYSYAATAYDQARNIGLPWRMAWYQFGIYEAYFALERYGDMIALAQASLNDGGGQYVEETYYYGGLARQGLGEFDRAISNYNAAIQFNPNFTPAIEARDALQASLVNNG